MRRKTEIESNRERGKEGGGGRREEGTPSDVGVGAGCDKTRNISISVANRRRGRGGEWADIKLEGGTSEVQGIRTTLGERYAWRD